uniref:50S ribosomal protein L9 n=1 Tax=Anthurium amnicola TaxID=1678845 RepID=A0A1D1YFI9_9ARAE
MRPLSSLGIGLSLVFGCLFLALVAEVYYLLWWKKKVANGDVEDEYTSSPRELLYLFCWRKPSSLRSEALNPQQLCSSVRTTEGGVDAQRQHDSSSSKALLTKPFLGGEDGVDAELMRLHSLSGPPRFLFTIKEETKEDLESEDGKSRGDRSRKGSRGRSLSDVFLATESPFLTPLASPPFFTPPLTPMHRYSQHGFNPLFESSKHGDRSKIGSSPPPKFKFLKDAEEKLYRKTLMEEALKVEGSGVLAEDNVVLAPPGPGSISSAPVPSTATASSTTSSEEDGSFITIIISKTKEQGQHQHHLTSSQVAPLPSSPSNVRRHHASFHKISDV